MSKPIIKTTYPAEKCTRCPTRPCMQSTYGITLVHNSKLGNLNCPLANNDISEIERLFSCMPTSELDMQARHLISGASPDEQLCAGFSCSLSEYTSETGTINLLLALWKLRVFSVLSLSSSSTVPEHHFNTASGSFVASRNATTAQDDEQEENVTEELSSSITNLQWLYEGSTIVKSHVGDNVALAADTTNIENGTPVRVDIYEKDEIGNDDFICTLAAVVESDKISCTWKVEYHADDDDTESEEEIAEKGYTLPEYMFKISCRKYGATSGESTVLEVADRVGLQLVNKEDDTPIANADYYLVMPDGSLKMGTLDAEGRITEEWLPPGHEYSVVIADRQFDYARRK